jgi:hypothetical protein
MVARGVLGDAVDGRPGNVTGHLLRLCTPRLIGHFVDVAIRAGQVAPAMDLQDELLEGHWLMAGSHRGRDV